MVKDVCPFSKGRCVWSLLFTGVEAARWRTQILHHLCNYPLSLLDKRRLTPGTTRSHAFGQLGASVARLSSFLQIMFGNIKWSVIDYLPLDIFSLRSSMMIVSFLDLPPVHCFRRRESDAHSLRNWAVSSGKEVLMKMPDPISNPAGVVNLGII